jgi:hypothetical protein
MEARLLRKKLLQIVASGKFELVKLFNHPDDVVEIIAHVLLGVTIDDHDMRPAQPVEHALKNHKRYLSAIKGRGTPDMQISGKPVLRYKNGMKQTGMVFRGRGSGRQGIAQHVDNFEYPAGKEATEGWVTLPDAWQIMQQHGEHCAIANNEKIQKIKWFYREIPGGLEPKEERRGPGRPKRSDMEVRA